MSPAPLWATRMKFGGGGAVRGIGAVWVRIANSIATIRINNEEMRVSFMVASGPAVDGAGVSVRQFEIGNWRFRVEGRRGLTGETWAWLVELEFRGSYDFVVCMMWRE